MSVPSQRRPIRLIFQRIMTNKFSTYPNRRTQNFYPVVAFETEMKSKEAY